VVSLRWHLRAAVIRNGLPEKGDLSEQNSSLEKNSLQVSDWLIAVLHVFQCGVLWRYFKLFVPVDLRFVKHEVSFFISCIYEISQYPNLTFLFFWTGSRSVPVKTAACILWVSANAAVTTLFAVARTFYERTHWPQQSIDCSVIIQCMLGFSLIQQKR